jgi:hypothetical protein
MTEQKNTSKKLASDSVCVVDATIDAIQPCVLNKDWFLLYTQGWIERTVTNV